MVDVLFNGVRRRHSVKGPSGQRSESTGSVYDLLLSGGVAKSDYTTATEKIIN